MHQQRHRTSSRPYVIAVLIGFALFGVQWLSAEIVQALGPDVTSDSESYALVSFLVAARRILNYAIIGYIAFCFLFLGFFVEMVRAMRGDAPPTAEKSSTRVDWRDDKVADSARPRTKTSDR
jgi:hypothetical protein